MMTTHAACLVTQHAELTSPTIIISGQLLGPNNFQRFVTGVATPAELREIGDRLDQIEREQVARIAAALPEPLAPIDEPPEVVALRIEALADATDAAAYRASTAGRLEAIEGLLERIATALEQR